MKLQIKSIITTLVASLTLTACASVGEDYTKRLLVSETLTIAAGAKTAVVEYYEKNGSLPSSNAQAGLPEPNELSSRAMDSLTVSSGGEIIVRMSDQVNAGAELKHTPVPPTSPSEQWSWKCQPNNEKMQSRWLPPQCRE